jgi:hypothetical protein
MSKWRVPAALAAAGGGGTAVNMEWGAFFSTQLPRCYEDLQARRSPALRRALPLCAQALP